MLTISILQECAPFSATKVIQKDQAMVLRKERLDKVPKPWKEEFIYIE